MPGPAGTISNRYANEEVDFVHHWLMRDGLRLAISCQIGMTINWPLGSLTIRQIPPGGACVEKIDRLQTVWTAPSAQWDFPFFGEWPDVEDVAPDGCQRIFPHARYTTAERRQTRRHAWRIRVATTSRMAT
jgi:hypothetical protein